MALSGNFVTSNSGQGGGNFYGQTIFSWSRTGWGYSGSVAYHDIYWEWRTYGGSSGYYQYFYQGSGNVAGGGFSIPSPVQAYGNGATLFRNGSFRLYTDSAGNASFGASVQGGVYNNTINTSGSGSWGLDNIPLTATITGTSSNINDESNPYITYNNPAGHGINAWLELPSLTGSTQYAGRGGYGNGAAWNLTTGERDAIRAAMANTNATTIRYVIYDTVTGGYGINDYTISIVNANPTFTTIAYHDSNSSTSTITGNNQFIVQNTSVVNVDISSGNKAVAQKGASMVSYTATINSTPTNFAYSGSTINQALATGSAGAATNQTLSVTATDSRGNTTTAQKTVTMVPYAAPLLNVIWTREDGFGADTTIDATGTISTLTVSGTDKNSVNGTSGMGYKVWKVGDSEPGSYTNIASTRTGATINPTSDPIETLDQSFEYNLKVKITDVLQTVVYTTLIGIGSAAFRIGTDGLLYNANKRIFAALDLYPVGTVLLTTVNTSPQTLLGGTWTATTTASASILGETMYGFKRTA